MGETGNNFATLCNISQQKKHTEVGTTAKGDGKRENTVREAGRSTLPTPSPPPFPFPYLHCGNKGGVLFEESSKPPVLSCGTDHDQIAASLHMEF